MKESGQFPRGPDVPAPWSPMPGVADRPDGYHERFDRSVDKFGDLGTPGGASEVVMPFQVSIVGTDMTVRPGTINGIQPSNNGNTFDLTAFVGLTCFLVLNVSSTDGVVQSATLSVDATPPAAIDTTLGFPPNTFKILLYVIQDLTEFRVIGPTSLQATSLEAFRVQKVMTTPDMLPYDSHYTWRLTNV